MLKHIHFTQPKYVFYSNREGRRLYGGSGWAPTIIGAQVGGLTIKTTPPNTVFNRALDVTTKK